MDASQVQHVENRVLILAPLGRDGDVLCRTLSAGGVHCEVCPDHHALLKQINAGVAAVLFTSEALTPMALQQLLPLIERQPSWSDLPLIVLVSGEELANAESSLEVIHCAANVTLIERPTRGFTLLTVLRSALRARQRQYQTRDLLERERTARAEADRANRSQEDFLATITHELGTPLSAILLWSKLALAGKISASDLPKTFAIIHQSAAAQAALVGDLLDAARIASGKLLLDCQEVQLAPAAEKAVDVVRALADAKGLRLKSLIDPFAGLVRADLARMEQVISNLLVNAVKFTPPDGSVRLTLQRDGDHVQVQVTDTGPGIDGEFMPHVFERFSQATVDSNRAKGGLGLGLAISKEIVELHGGTISATAPGELGGATFTVRVPMLRP